LGLSSRIQEVHSIGGNDLASFSFPAPFLYSLTLSFHFGRRALPCLFSDHTPNLRRPTLRDVSNWPENHFRDLTHVFLHDTTTVGQKTPAELLDFLRWSPLLEELTLVFVGPWLHLENAEHILQRNEPVQFNHLRILEFGEWHSMEAIARLLLRWFIVKSTSAYGDIISFTVTTWWLCLTLIRPSIPMTSQRYE
jgi:hypothetical protein